LHVPCIMIGLMCSSTAIHAQVNNGYSELIAESRKFIMQRMNTDSLVGVSAALIVGDSVVWKEGFGFENKEKGIPMSTNTVASIGSITNTVTVLGIMQLQEKGLIDISRPLVSYLPQFSIKTRVGNIKQVTPRKVMIHTSGIPTNAFNNYDLRTGRYTDVAGYLSKVYLADVPGGRSLYSNLGYSILGHTIKEITHQDYTDYVKQHIFRPLGMNSSGFSFDSTLPHKSPTYLKAGRGTENFEVRDIPANGIYSCVEDLVKYARALMNAYNGSSSEAIKSETAREIFRLQNGDIQLETNKKGLGWFMFKNDSAFAVFHAGNTLFPAGMLLIPEKKAAAIILVNTRGGIGMANEFCFQLLGRFRIGVSDIVPPPIVKNIHLTETPANIPVNKFRKHLGHYAMKYGYLTFDIKDGKPLITENDTRYMLKPMTENEFIPVLVTEKDSLIEKSDERFVFLDINKQHVLIRKIRSSEYQLGYKMDGLGINDVWKARLGTYKQFGGQLPSGFDQLTETELFVTADSVLMLRLITTAGKYQYPLNIISDHEVITGGISPEETGITINIDENEKTQVMTYCGLTFKKNR
jgi:CubicO group peptidase (beta-lactamase class C family)